MGMFDDAAAFADGQFAEVFGVTVVIVRGEQSSDPITAEVFLRDYPTIDPDLPVTVQSWDYLIPADLYRLAGSVVDPREGDVIRQLIRGTERLFLLAPVASRPACEPADQNGRLWLVHTKKVG